MPAQVLDHPARQLAEQRRDVLARRAATVVVARFTSGQISTDELAAALAIITARPVSR